MPGSRGLLLTASLYSVWCSLHGVAGSLGGGQVRILSRRLGGKVAGRLRRSNRADPANGASVPLYWCCVQAERHPVLLGGTVSETQFAFFNRTFDHDDGPLSRAVGARANSIAAPPARGKTFWIPPAKF